MKIITLKKIEKKYEAGNIALKNIDLEIEEGEFLVILGPSGSGKSTLLRMIAGLEAISGGELCFFSPKQEKDIAMVFQNYALYPHMNVYDNIAFPLQMKHLPKQKIEEKVIEVAQLLEIKNLLKKRVQSLSGGEKQRVALARAMVRDANIFLFDEALANLDANLKSQMRYELLSLHKKLKKTFLYVTHDQTEAMSMADRIVVMRNGEIEQIAKPKDLYQNPNTSFIAKFIGNPPMNLLEEEKQILGIRPEDIQISTTETKNSFPFLIEMIEFLGNHYFLHGNIEGKKLIIQVPIETEYKKGEILFVEFPPTKCYYFDSFTGQRIRS